MEWAGATHLHRKTGGAKWSDCLNCQGGYGKGGSGAASENAVRLPLCHSHCCGSSQALLGREVDLDLLAYLLSLGIEPDQ